MARALDTMLFGDVLLCNFQLTKFFVLFEDTKLFKGLVETGRLIHLEGVQKLPLDFFTNEVNCFYSFLELLGSILNMKK